MRTVLFSASVLHIGLSILLSSAVQAEPAPQLDGFTTDPIWAAQARTWTLSDPAQPGSVARYYLAYDDRYLYFAAEVFDRNVIGSNRLSKSRVWEDDSVRLLLHLGDPKATQWTGQTFSYTFGALGGATWNRGPLPAASDKTVEPGWPPAWNSAMNWAAGLKPGTTPNVSSNDIGGYVVEARIPWSELGANPPFKPGSTMGICILNLRRPEMNLPGGKPLSTVQAACELNPPNPSLWERVSMNWPGPLPTRGLVEPLPLWLGSPDMEFEVYKSAETDSRGPWLDRTQWTRRLELMRAQNLNTLLLRHSNPLIGLLAGAALGHKVDTRPADPPRDAFVRTGWFSAEEFPRHRDQFRWLLAEAKRNGVNVYLLLDGNNEPRLSPCSQPSTQASTASADAPKISRAVVQLFDEYADLSGVAAGMGFNSPTTLQAIADGLASRQLSSASATTPAPHAPTSSTSPAQAAHARSLPITASLQPGPEFLIWTDGIEPEVARRILDRHPKTQLLHPLAGGQWLAPLADRRIAAFNSRAAQLRPGPACDPLRSIAVGTMRGVSSYMLWADPRWMRNLLMDVRNQGIQGFLLDFGPGEHGLAREAMADYAFNASQQYSPQRWERRLNSLGIDQYAGQLLEAVQHASAIMPQALLLVNDSSGRFMPQFGLPLSNCLKMPSYSPTAIGLDADSGRGLLITPLGPAWSSPSWGRSAAGISAGVSQNSPPGAVPAWEIIAELVKHVQSCNAVLTTLRHLPPKSEEQARSLGAMLDRIEFNTAMGNFLALRLQAAMAFEQYKARRGRMVDLIDLLRRSVEAYRKAAVIGDRLYPRPVTFWELQMVSPPPWTAESIQRNYVAKRGRWADRLIPLEREFAIVNEESARVGASLQLPLWDHLNAAPPEKRQTRVVIDFEKPDQRYHLLAGASLSSDPEHLSKGTKTLLIDTRQMPPGFHEVFTTDVGLVPLVSLLHYEVAVAYHVIDPGPADAAGVSEPFEIGLRPSTGYQPMGDHRCWTAPKGYRGVRVLQVPPPATDGNVLYIGTRSQSAIAIDHIQISQVIE